MSSETSDQIIGPFRVIRQLGVGGMGMVYLVEYIKNGQSFALKMLSPGLLSDKRVNARFEREIRILKRMKHANIVRVFGWGKHEGQRYIVMEYVDGGSLEDRLRKKGRLNWKQALTATRQVSLALEYLHNQGIIHRDLKPANFLLTRDGRLKLSDFGIARDTEATALTERGKTVGTYAYMAPEQISGQDEISKKTDLYALGIVLFEMIAGRTPFTADTPPQMLFHHLEDDPPDASEFAPDCPPEIDRFIDRLLEKKPEDRPFDALAVHTELGELREKIDSARSTATGGRRDGTKSVSESDWEYLKSAFGVAGQGDGAMSPAAAAAEKKKKKKKKRKIKEHEFVPFYEQTWFLATCLVLILVGVTYAMWPLSGGDLYARARAAMETDDVEQWHDAQKDYIDVYLEKYPDGEHHVEMLAFDDRIEVRSLRKRILDRLQRGMLPRSSAGKRFGNAWRYEDFGDPETAIRRYLNFAEGVENGSIQLDEYEQDRHYVQLVNNQIAALKAAYDPLPQTAAVINRKLTEADEHANAGNVPDAESIWDDVSTLYKRIPAHKALVEYAEARLEGRSNVPRPDAKAPESSETPPDGPNDQ